MIEPKTVHTPADAIEKAKEHARDAEAMLDRAQEDGATILDQLILTSTIALGQAWATIAIAQRSGR